MFSNMKGGKPPVSLRSGNVSICHPWGHGTCQRAALQRYIPPLTRREITLFVLCQSPQILQWSPTGLFLPFFEKSRLTVTRQRKRVFRPSQTYVYSTDNEDTCLQRFYLF